MLTHRLLPLLLVPVLAAPALGGWWDDIYEEKTVALSDILKRPESFRGIDVAFVVQFHAVGEIDNPFYTKFEKDYYLNFSVWADDAPIWDRDAYQKDFPYMFIERNAPEHVAFVKARMYDRFAVVGHVAEVFRGKPWIEVKGFRRVEGAMTEPSLAHMVKAFTFRKYHKHAVAAHEFQRALSDTLPPAVRLTILRSRAESLLELGQNEAALGDIDSALDLAKEDPGLLAMRDRCTITPATGPGDPLTPPEGPDGTTPVTAEAPPAPATPVEPTPAPKPVETGNNNNN